MYLMKSIYDLTKFYFALREVAYTLWLFKHLIS
jgi:hypothetical protein